MLLEAVIAQKIKERKEAELSKHEQVLQVPVEPMSYTPEKQEKLPENSKIIEIELA